MNFLKKLLHFHQWVEFGDPVRGRESLDPKHHIMPDIFTAI